MQRTIRAMSLAPFGAVLVAALGLGPAELSGQGNPYQVANLEYDIGFFFSENAHSPFQLEDKGFFLLSEPHTGTELWVSDGTFAGTRLIADVCPGPCAVQIAPFATGRHHAYFTTARTVDAGAPGIPGSALWITDGTASGTYEIDHAGEFAPLAVREDPERLLYARSHLEEGWQLVRFSPGAIPIAIAEVPGRPQAPALLGEDVLFSLDIANSAQQLWKTDGSAAGTSLVEDLGCCTFSTTSFALADSVLFVGPGSSSFEAVWRTDGTSAGTFVLAEVEASSFVGDTNQAFFVGEVDFDTFTLWRTDGTLSGTRLLISTPSRPSLGTVFAGSLYFLNGDARGDELWTSDGTVAGTRIVRDLCPGSCSSNPQAFMATGQGVFFSAWEPQHGMEPWFTNGTPAGTRLLAETSDADFAEPGPYLPVGDRVLFAADFGDLWSSDGTPTGTRLLVSSQDHEFQTHAVPILDGVAYFAFEEHDGGFSLWQSNATPAGTGLLGSTPSIALDRGSAPHEVTGFEGHAYFFADVFSSPRLWRTDGAPGEVEEVPVPPDFSPGFANSGLRAIGADLFIADLEALWVLSGGAISKVLPFRVNPAAWGEYQGELLMLTGFSGLWKSDGTAEGSVFLGDLEDPTFYDPKRQPPFGLLDGRAVFLARQDPFGNSFFWTDGTPAGTELLFSGEPLFADIVGWIPYQDTVYMLDSQHQLWRGDRQSAELVPVAQLDGVPGSETEPEMSVIGNRLLFVLWDRLHGEELFVSDGTAGGTALLLDLWPGPGGARPRELVHFAGRLYFVADTPEHGAELWRTDGTVAGTQRVHDLRPGPPGSRPFGLKPIGDQLYFAANDGASGFEPWRSDGVVAQSLGDIAKGPGSSTPSEFLELGDGLLFSADDGAYGQEPWALLLAGGSGDGCTADGETLCLLGDRFEVTVRWRDNVSGDTGRGQARPFPGSDQTGTFWFFDPQNVELLVKALDGTPINEHYWLFYGALSDVEYWIDVRDSESGEVRTYYNPQKNLCGQGDIEAFAANTPRSFEAIAATPRSTPLGRRVIGAAAAQSATCTGDDLGLCLNQGRFRVEVEWRDPRSGDTGVGYAIPGTEDTGYFWFFDSQNVELAVKVLDARPINGRFWVFYGALSDVEYTLHVRDSETGSEKSYTNPPFDICGRADIEAF